MGPDPHTPRADQENYLATFWESARFKNKLSWSETLYSSAAIHFQGPEAIFMHFICMRNWALLWYFRSKFHFNCTQLFLLWGFLKFIFYTAFFGHPALMRCHQIFLYWYNWTHYKKLRNNFNLHYIRSCYCTLSWAHIGRKAASCSFVLGGPTSGTSPLDAASRI